MKSVVPFSFTKQIEVAVVFCKFDDRQNSFAMKTVTVVLPDSVEMSEAQIQELVLAKIAEHRKAASPAPAASLAAPFGRNVSEKEAADIRHLIGLYYAERAADLVDEQWNENAWTAETMHKWVREHLRTAHGRPS